MRYTRKKIEEIKKESVINIEDGVCFIEVANEYLSNLKLSDVELSRKKKILTLGEGSNVFDEFIKDRKESSIYNFYKFEYLNRDDIGKQAGRGYFNHRIVEMYIIHNGLNGLLTKDSISEIVDTFNNVFNYFNKVYGIKAVELDKSLIKYAFGTNSQIKPTCFNDEYALSLKYSRIDGISSSCTYKKNLYKTIFHINYLYNKHIREIIVLRWSDIDFKAKKVVFSYKLNRQYNSCTIDNMNSTCDLMDRVEMEIGRELFNLLEKIECNNENISSNQFVFSLEEDNYKTIGFTTINNMLYD